MLYWIFIQRLAWTMSNFEIRLRWLSMSTYHVNGDNENRIYLLSYTYVKQKKRLSRYHAETLNRIPVTSRLKIVAFPPASRTFFLFPGAACRILYSSASRFGTLERTDGGEFMVGLCLM